MVSQLCSIIIENIFALTLFLSFMIYYTVIPYTLYSSCFIFVFVLILLTIWLHTYKLHGYMIMICSFVTSILGVFVYYVVNNLFTTKYRILVFLFPVSFMVLFNVSKILMYIAPVLAHLPQLNT
jgi:hypothetical protein